jgi:hypothetical protein
MEQCAESMEHGAEDVLSALRPSTFPPFHNQTKSLDATQEKGWTAVIETIPGYQYIRVPKDCDAGLRTVLGLLE